MEASSIGQARERIRQHVRKTPLEESAYLGSLTGARVLLKLENFQLTGSFKVRGALSKILSLSEDERARGVVAASAGNHGLGVAYACGRVGVEGEVFLPQSTADGTRDAIRALGGRVTIHGSDCLETERAARRAADQSGRAYVSPYNDAEVVAGQGTIGLEIAEETGKLDEVLVAVGGGGLIAGVGLALESKLPGCRIVACSPERSCVLHESLRVGRILDLESQETLSHSTAGGIEDDAITFDLCRRLVGDSVLVSEEEIAAAMRLAIDRHRMLIEGAAGVAIAGLLSRARSLQGKTVAVIVCGANVSAQELAGVLQA